MTLYYELYTKLIELQEILKSYLAEQIRATSETGYVAPSIALLAIGLGTVHALTPGHGKAVVVSYFLGRDARPLEGFAMAARVAFSHTVAAIILVIFFGSAVSILGRPSGAASWLQSLSYGMIALIGAYYLHRALGRPSHHQVQHASILPYAVGVLPCPLTMLVVGHAMALKAIGTGLVLAALMGTGAALAIGLCGTISIVTRRGVLGRIDPESRALRLVLQILEVGSSAAILALGAVFFAGSIR
jgi:nickel/cobalt transporter (NicO) family protein